MQRVAKPRDNRAGWVVLVGGILFLALISQCSSQHNSSTNLSADLNYSAAMSNAVAAQAPPPVLPVSAASVTRGISHLRTTFAAEGFSGAMIYSQNCYEALARHFTWPRLDQCGAFDALTVRSIADADTTGLDNELSWFQSETAAGRYLAAATGGGEPADEADRRFGDIQTRAGRARTVGRRAAAPTPDNDNLVNALIEDSANDQIDEE